MAIPAHRRPPLLPEGYGLGAHDSLPSAVGYMLLSGACLAVMGAMVKAAGDLPVYEKVFFRNLVTLLVTVAMAVRRRENPFGPTHHRGLLLARSFAGLGGVFLYGERLTGRIAVGLVLAFAGAALVLQPSLDLEPLPALAGLGSALFAGLAYTIVRRLKGRERPFRIVFYFSLISTLACLPFLIADPVVPSGWQWVWLIGTGVAAAGGQVFLTMASHRAPAAQISIWGYNHVLFSLLIGLIVWGEQPDVLTYAGGALILLAALLNRRTRTSG